MKDIYHALTDKDTLDKILEQGLKEKHRQYKYKIIEFLGNIKDRIKLEDLTFYSA